MGLVADIQPADIELRRSILDSKLTRFAPLDVPADVIEFLARTINRNVRELVGGLNKLIAYAQLTGQEVSLQLAEEQLTDILSANRKRITIDEIQRTVCQFYRVDRSEMSSKRRARAVVRPRQVAMYLAKVLTPRSLPRDRAQVRRPRPLDGDPRGAADRGPAQARRRHGRRRAQPVETAGKLIVTLHTQSDVHR